MDIQSADNLGVQLYFDETSYRTMFEALEDVLRAKGNRLAELRDTLLGTMKAGFRELYPVRFPWLNSTQETAVNKVLCARDVAIVHGPPGTGKTTTLVEAIYETLHREPQVLVCAQSNMAVDWISEKLVDRGVNVLRIGNPTRVNDKMLSFTYERRFENHPLYPELWSIRKELRQLGGRARRGSYDEREGIRSRMSRLRDRATALEVQINTELLVSAHICLCRAFGLDIAALHGVQQHCGLDHVGLIEIAVRQFVFRDGSADYQMSVGPGKLIGCDVFSIQHIGNRDIPRKLRILQVPLIIERTSLRGHCDRVPIQ